MGVRVTDKAGVRVEVRARVRGGYLVRFASFAEVWLWLWVWVWV